MKMPKFWENYNLFSFALYPFSILYGVGVELATFFSIPYKSKIKVFCIGNMVVGGAGKTPIAIEIGKILKEKKIKFAFLSRGYKGIVDDFTKVTKNHTAKEVGDEPLILSEFADTFVCKNRKFALKELEKTFDYEIILMDDGFQNPHVYKDKNIIVVDGVYGLGNGFLLPAGPLRDSTANALSRATFFIIVGQDNHSLCDKLYKSGFNVIKGYIESTNKTADISEKYVAFAGIGRPSKFFDTLKQNDYNVIKTLDFDDHYTYTEEDLQNITDVAKVNNAKIITTKKDWVKLPNSYKEKIEYLDINIKFYDREKFTELILKK